jgi:hypothetical protein
MCFVLRKTVWGHVNVRQSSQVCTQKVLLFKFDSKHNLKFPFWKILHFRHVNSNSHLIKQFISDIIQVDKKTLFNIQKIDFIIFE